MIELITPPHHHTTTTTHPTHTHTIQVVEAIRAGYRCFDSASDYGNETQTGAGGGVNQLNYLFGEEERRRASRLGQRSRRQTEGGENYSFGEITYSASGLFGEITYPVKLLIR